MPRLATTTLKRPWTMDRASSAAVPGWLLLRPQQPQLRTTICVRESRRCARRSRLPLPDEVGGCTIEEACNYNPEAVENNSCDFSCSGSPIRRHATTTQTQSSRMVPATSIATDASTPTPATTIPLPSTTEAATFHATDAMPRLATTMLTQPSKLAPATTRYADTGLHGLQLRRQPPSTTEAVTSHAPGVLIPMHAISTKQQPLTMGCDFSCQLECTISNTAISTQRHHR